VRDRLDQRVFRRAWQRGEQIELDELVDQASQTARTLRDSSRRDQAAAGQSAAYGLTERELAVLRLLSQGLTNREIGVRLMISTGTAGVHVSNILRKLGVSSRVQAVGIAHRFGLGPPA